MQRNWGLNLNNCTKLIILPKKMSFFVKAILQTQVNSFNTKFDSDYQKDWKYIFNSGCVTRGVALPFTLKSILRQKKNYGNSNISPCKNIPNLQKNPLKETKILQDIITLELISSFNTSQNIIFQKSSYKNRPIIYYLGAKIH